MIVLITIWSQEPPEKGRRERKEDEGGQWLFDSTKVLSDRNARCSAGEGEIVATEVFRSVWDVVWPGNSCGPCQCGPKNSWIARTVMPNNVNI